eukprot:scaffold34748_cov68-Phaeocystis_antarctica.AAC.4
MHLPRAAGTGTRPCAPLASARRSVCARRVPCAACNVPCAECGSAVRCACVRCALRCACLQLVVAERDVDVEGSVVAVLEQQPLVDVRRLLEVVAKVVDGGEAQLVRSGVA